MEFMGLKFIRDGAGTAGAGEPQTTTIEFEEFVPVSMSNCVICSALTSGTSTSTSSFFQSQSNPDDSDAIRKPSTNFLFNLCKILKISTTIYSHIDVGSLSSPLYCSSCEGLVSESLKILKEIEEQERILASLVDTVKSNLTKSYGSSEDPQVSMIKTEDGNDSSEDLSSDRDRIVKYQIQKTFAQCLSNCTVNVRANHTEQFQLNSYATKAKNSTAIATASTSTTTTRAGPYSLRTPARPGSSKQIYPPTRPRLGRDAVASFVEVVFESLSDVEESPPPPSPENVSELWNEGNDNSPLTPQTVSQLWDEDGDDTDDKDYCEPIKKPALKKRRKPIRINVETPVSVSKSKPKVTPKERKRKQNFPVKQDNFECSTCHENFPTLPTLSQHELTHSFPSEKFFDELGNLAKFKCGHCQKEYLKSSYQAVAVPLPLPSESTEELHPVFTDILTCHNDDCNVTFTDFAEFQLHHGTVCCPSIPVKPPQPNEQTMKHVPIKSPSASAKTTDTKFPTSASASPAILHTMRTLKIDRSKQTPGRIFNFTCEVCGKGYDNVIHYNNHIKAHEGDLQFSCDVCQEKFVSERSVKLHILKIHKVRDADADADLSLSGGDPNKVPSMDAEETVPQKNKCNSYVCTVCGKGYEDKFHYDNHVKKHAGVLQFSCHICLQTFVSERSVNLHITRVHKPRDKDADAEKKPVPVSANETNSVLQKEKTNYVCSLCSKSYEDKFHYENHVKKHKGDLQFPCQLCQQKFVSLRSVNLHVRKIHPSIPKEQQPNNFECFPCRVRFSTEELLEIHNQRKHTNERESRLKFKSTRILDEFGNIHSFICSYCKKEYKKSPCMTSDGVGVFIECDIWGCDKKYPMSEFIPFCRHHESTCPEKPKKVHKCDSCDKTFYNSASLNNHRISLHTKNYPYCCDTCGKGMASLTNLNSHKQNVHSGYAHKCKICGLGFKIKKRLGYHMRRHNNDLRYVCANCGKAFLNGAQLKIHEIVVHSKIGNNFPCNICSKAFKTRNYLRHHIWAVHEKARKFPSKTKGGSGKRALNITQNQPLQEDDNSLNEIEMEDSNNETETQKAVYEILIENSNSV